LGWLYKEQKEIEKSESEFSSARQVIQRLGSNIDEEPFRSEFIDLACESLPKEKVVSKRQSEAEKFGGLTPRERGVARLLSEGKSNREIAEQLVLSERTVENHVGNILTKLGFNSRAQIAVWPWKKNWEKKKIRIASYRAATRHTKKHVVASGLCDCEASWKEAICSYVDALRLRTSALTTT
jgi:DNA-binding CsgD family transcriptional regulator